MILLIGLSGEPAKFVDLGIQRFDEKKANVTSTLYSILSETGDRGRLKMWSNTIELIGDSPLLGVGPGGWKRKYPLYDQGAMIRRNSSPVRPHNDFLWIASEQGLLGLTAYLFLLVVAFRRLLLIACNPNVHWRLNAPFFAISLLAILGHSFFSFPKELPQATMHFYLLLGLIAGFPDQDRSVFRSRIGGSILMILTISVSLTGTIVAHRQLEFDRHYLQALQAEDNGDWDTVHAQINQALQAGTFRTHGFVILGRAEEKHNRFKEAELAYRQALELSPNAWHAHNGLGVSLKRQGRLEEASRHYQLALKLFPMSFDVQNNLGALYKSMGDTLRAEQSFRMILRAKQLDPGANNNLGNLFKARGQIDSAIVAYRTALKEDPRLAQAHFNLANLLFDLQEFYQAEKSYADFLDIWQGDSTYTAFALDRLAECREKPSTD